MPKEIDRMAKTNRFILFRNAPTIAAQGIVANKMDACSR